MHIGSGSEGLIQKEAYIIQTKPSEQKHELYCIMYVFATSQGNEIIRYIEMNIYMYILVYI